MHFFRGIASLTAIVLLFIFINMHVVYAENYYVAKDGNDNNTGIFTSPFRSIGRAATIAQAGDTVFIREGVYRERLAVRNSGQPGAYITFQNYKQESVVINADSFQHGVMLYGVSYIKIYGLQIKNSSHAGIHIHHHMDSTDKGSDHNIIQGNTVSYCGTEGYSGIYIGGHNNQIIDNKLLNNGMIEEENPRDHGIYLLGNNNSVSNNYAAYNARIGIRAEGANNQINSNVLENNGESGIAVWVDKPLAGRHFTIYKNLIVNNPKDGITINGGGSGEKPFDIKIYNNTIVSEFSQAGLRIINGSRYVKIKNNIIMGNFSQAFLGTDNKSIEGYEEDHNMFYGNGAFYYNGIRYEDLISYKSKSAWGTNSIFENPNLNSDYSLSSNSIAIENGTDVGLPFEGEKPSIGAFEYGEDGVSNASVPSIMFKSSNTDAQ